MVDVGPKPHTRSIGGKFLKGDDFMDVIKGAISLGGDSDTIAAIAQKMKLLMKFNKNVTIC